MLLRTRALSLIARDSQRTAGEKARRTSAGLRLAFASLVVAVGAVPAEAVPFAHVVGANNATDVVDVATNAEASASATLFATDSLAIDPAGSLYSADPNGVIFDVTSPGNFPVGPTGFTQIADLDYAGNGLWGFSNQSQTLFFFDLTLNAVTSTLSDPVLSAYTITGVARRASDGSTFLSGYDALLVDWLFEIAPSATSAALVGSLAHGDGASYVSDIDFDPSSGTLYAMTWFHRWFYTVDPATAATTFVSAGPHRDATGMALLAIPEPGSLFLTLTALSAFAGHRTLRRLSERLRQCRPRLATEGAVTNE
jgi:hypothetical protein